MHNSQGKVVVITGAAGGLGARLLEASRGKSVDSFSPTSTGRVD